MPDPRLTPAMQQHARFKARHPDCILLFRMGDFYELFFEDAVTVSKAIGLTLTQRSEGVPMAGVPYHQLETYLRKLVAAGFRVAVVDQIQDPKDAKGIVARAVTRVITPGTLVDEPLIEDAAAPTLAAVFFPESGESSRAAVAIIELSTGSFIILDCAAHELADELSRRAVRELLFADAGDGTPPPRVKKLLDHLALSATPRPSWGFRADEALRTIRTHYGVTTLAGFGLSDSDAAIPAAGAALTYLRETQTATDIDADDPGIIRRKPTLAHLRPPRREDRSGFCIVDATSLRALEVERSIRGPSGIALPGDVSSRSGSGQPDGSLLGLFIGPGGACRTAMGKRLLRDWLCRPLANLDAIMARHSAVATLADGRKTAAQLGELLDRIQDVARIAGRIALARVSPRDVVALGKSLAILPDLRAALINAPSLAAHESRLGALADQLIPLAQRISTECVETPPFTLAEGGIIRDGVDAELDEARLLQRDAGAWLSEYQSRLNIQFDLPGLKVGFNKIFGYYIELPAAQARRAPAELVRKQTLKNAERYTTPELRDFESKVMTAEARAVERERVLFGALCDAAAALVTPIGDYGQVVAELDVLRAFADKAIRRGWTRPEMVAEPVLHLRSSRHPVVEERLGREFVPNDLTLGAPPEPLLPGGVGVGASRLLSTDDLAERHLPSRLTSHVSSPASHVSPSSPRLALITGPNMAGKSTFIRQVALNVLLAHAGSFIPADEAVIGLTDRIFTRVGADDALFAGQSTFMVEMTETANILNHATERSLVVLDEIGRGTSTLDGLSLAWAVAEYLAGSDEETERRRDEVPEPGDSAPVSADAASPTSSLPASPTPSLRHSVSPSLSPRTLFATHYHELTELEDLFPGRVCNLHVAVREWPPGDPAAQIVFLHRIMPGRTDRSYGIHVAKLAGIPAPVLARARQVMDSLSVEHSLVQTRDAAAPTSSPVPNGGGGRVREAGGGSSSSVSRLTSRVTPQPNEQLALFTEYVPHPATYALRELKIESLSPLQAFDELRKLKALIDADANPAAHP